MAHETSGGTCHLLELTGELRNRIYREVLIDDESTRDFDSKPILVPIRGYTEPALLLTCKMIRDEALPLYYSDNFFEVECEDFDCRAAVGFYAKHQKLMQAHKDHEKNGGKFWLGTDAINFVYGFSGSVS